MKTIKNEKGIAIVGTALMIMVIISIFILAISQFLSQNVGTSFQLRSRIAGIQVLQEFAVLAQRANEIYERTNSCGALTRLPAGRNFCWQLAAENNGSCVQSPLPGGGTTPLCMSVGNNELAVALQTTHSPSNFEVAKQQIGEWSERIAYRIFAELGAPLDAQENRAHLPTMIPASSSVDINNVNCGVIGGTCIRCNDANVECIDLYVCTNPSGCGAFAATNERWFRQKIAVIQTGTL